ncbi:hypothetical protein [Prosthecobacter sp.]|uniref:hypothetical protein n=1 Tax=Prosthecobacter sp. TaxID=1965333 RepID=UPI003783F14A
MRHTWHQFGKEFRYLRVRWFVLLAVVLLDLAVQMEWVLPMRALVPGGTDGISFASDILMRVLLWMVVWWFMLSVPPEEGAGSGQSYAQTRPLSRMSHWMARLLVWTVLVLLPLMLESAAYLLLQGRPFSDVALGMAERAWAAGAMTLWVLPLPLLLRGWERYAMIVLVILSAESPLSRATGKVFEALHLEYHPPQMAMEFGRNVQAAWLVGLLVPLLVMWHQRRALGMPARMGGLLLLTVLQAGVAASSLFSNAYEKPSDPKLIQKLAAGGKVVIPERDRRFQLELDKRGGKYILFRAHARLEGVPDEFVPLWRASSKTLMQNGGAMPAPPKEEMLRKPFYGLAYLCQYYPMASALPGGRPPGMFSLDVSVQTQNLQAWLPQPAKLDVPVDARLGLTAEWARVRNLGEMPIRAGAKLAAPDFKVELLEVRPNMDGQGNKSTGCVTVVYRMSARSFEWRNDLLPLSPHACIVSEKNRLMWQFVVHSGYEQMRGANLGWCQMIQQQTYQRVLGPGTGVTAENLAEQKLMWLKPEYVGSSEHAFEMKDVTMEGYVHQENEWPKSQPSTYAGNPREGFLKQVREMVRPGEEAGREEIARYVAGVYQASQVFVRRTERGNDGELKWPGSEREVHVLLAPFLLKAPEVFRAGLAHDNAELTQGVVREAVLQAGIPGIARSEKTGEPRYEREVPVQDKPGQTTKRTMETLWLASYDRSFEAYLEAIRKRSDEPLWPLMDEKPRSAEEVLADFAKTFDCGELRWLMKQPDVKYREEAERLTREAFAQLPPAMGVNRSHEGPLFSAVALGLPEALDWLLRVVVLKEDEDARGLLLQHNAIFGQPEKGQPDVKTLKQFLQDARRHTAKDYRYDAAKMIWELLPDQP